MHHALRHGEGAIADVDRQHQLGHRVYRYPHPVRSTRQAFEGLGLADLTILDRTEQGIEFVQLHLRDAHVVEEILGEGFEMVGSFDQPLQYRVGVDLEHPGDGTNAQPFRQCAHGPHQSLSRPTLAMHRRPVGFEEVAPTGGAVQLAPGTAAGMPIGAEIAEPHPALIRTIRMRAEMLRGVHLARPSPRGDHGGWWATGRLGCVRVGLLTGGTGGLAGEARKRLRGAGALARWRQRLGWPLIPSGTLVWPSIMQHDAEPEESEEHQLVEKEVGYHGKAPHTGGEMGGLYLICWRRNYPQDRGTRPANLAPLWLIWWA